VLPHQVLDTVDLMVIPGLAADPRGNRLGRGGGWYDRARASHAQLPTWLLLNDDEVIDGVPTDAWDLPVNLIVTPTQTITVVSRAASPA
jgi:5-formyltetrahydrofolate cyclo-ligase